MAKFGDWKKLKHIMSKYDQLIMKNCSVALMQAALKLVAIIKNRILDGKGMSPLHGFTIEMKGSSKPLIDEGDLLGSVDLRFIEKHAVFVGVHRKSPEGVNIAAIHEREQGTRIKVTPKMRAYLHARGLHLKPETDESEILLRFKEIKLLFNVGSDASGANVLLVEADGEIIPIYSADLIHDLDAYDISSD